MTIRPASPSTAIGTVERCRYASVMSVSPLALASGSFEKFRPHPLLRGGHLQTLFPFWFPGIRDEGSAERVLVPLADGDAVVLHDDCPEAWTLGGGAVLMLHGLAGCHRSPYMVRIAKTLNERGLRTFRMNARSAGDGMMEARFPYHAGRSADVAAAIAAIADRCPGSPILLIGFSLGAVVMLKHAGESGGEGHPAWKGLLAVCPPIDLSRCVLRLRTQTNRLYDWYFCRLLRKHLQAWQAVNPDAPRTTFRRTPKRLLDFDQEFTAPLAGFDSAEDYYYACSPTRFLGRIEVPTLVLASCNDPLAPAKDLMRANVSPAVTTRIEPGGHLGFFSRQGPNGRRWLDSFAANWAESTLTGAP